MKKHFKEAVFDTAVASIINMPLNFLAVSLVFQMSLNEWQTTLFFTVFFSVIAIVRKTYIGHYFHTREIRKNDIHISK